MCKKMHMNLIRNRARTIKNCTLVSCFPQQWTGSLAAIEAGMDRCKLSYPKQLHSLHVAGDERMNTPWVLLSEWEMNSLSSHGLTKWSNEEIAGEG
jgi:hypothetical protein